jgi:hypothetical protein
MWLHWMISFFCFHCFFGSFNLAYWRWFARHGLRPSLWLPWLIIDLLIAWNKPGNSLSPYNQPLGLEGSGWGPMAKDLGNVFTWMSSTTGPFFLLSYIQAFNSLHPQPPSAWAASASTRYPSAQKTVDKTQSPGKDTSHQLKTFPGHYISPTRLASSFSPPYSRGPRDGVYCTIAQ